MQKSRETDSPNARVEIRLVANETERHAVCRFRYSVYVEEMHRPQRYADHGRKVIVDPLDEHSHTLAAWQNGNVIGTVRITLLRECCVGEYMDYYHLQNLGEDRLQSASITTRLMVHRDFRNGTLAVRIAKAVYALGLKLGVTLDFIDCNPHLVPFFSGLGYQWHRRDLVHPEYGAVAVLKLRLTDQAYLDELRSPFSKLLRVAQAEASRNQLQPSLLV